MLFDDYETDVMPPMLEQWTLNIVERVPVEFPIAFYLSIIRSILFQCYINFFIFFSEIMSLSYIIRSYDYIITMVTTNQLTILLWSKL
jgi:hypothetical protein